MFEVKMIMIDECGDEVIIDTLTAGNDLVDENYIKVWEDTKIEKAKKRFPEAYGFYFQDSRDFQRDYCSNEWEEFDEMMPCDYSGICAGKSCPMYWKCQH